MLKNGIFTNLKLARSPAFVGLRRSFFRPLSTAQAIVDAEDSNAAELDKKLIDPSSSSSSTPSVTLNNTRNEHPLLDIPPEEDPLIGYVVNSIMKDGRRHTAERRVSNMLLHIHAFTRAPPLPILRKAVELAAPSVRVVTMKRGGKSTYHPRALGEKQRTRYAMKWILQSSNSRTGKMLEERLAREIVAILRGDKSSALDNKEKMHILAMSNRGSIRA